MELINVYDLKWNYIGHFYHSTGYGIKAVGDFIRIGKMLYKRMGN